MSEQASPSPDASPRTPGSSPGPTSGSGAPWAAAWLGLGGLPRTVTVLSGGVGGARFVTGLLHLAARTPGWEPEVTVVANTADDIWLHGLKVCPDLDTVMYTLGGGIDDERGWGRLDETWNAKDELAAYGVEPTWFGLGDRDLATHLVRTQMLEAGFALSQVTEALCRRWQPGVRLLPMSDDRVETHVVIDDPETGERRAVHFQEYWVRHHAEVTAHAVAAVGLEDATPAPGVLPAVGEADVVLVPPSNPVVSLGPVLGVKGVRAALAAARGPVVGVSGIIGGDHVRGMARQLLPLVDVEVTAAAVAEHYGARGRRTRADALGVLDGWLVDTVDAAAVAELATSGLTARAVPLWMTDPAATADLAAEALLLAAERHPGRS